MDTKEPNENRASTGKASDNRHPEQLHAVVPEDVRGRFEIQNRVGSLLHAFTDEESTTCGVRWQAGKTDGFSHFPLRAGIKLQRIDGSTYEVNKAYGDDDTVISYKITHDRTGKEYYKTRQGLEQAINQNKIKIYET